MQNLSFRILDKLAVSTAPTETAFVSATTITRGDSQEHITYAGLGKKLYTTCGQRLHRARVHGQTYPIVVNAVNA